MVTQYFRQKETLAEEEEILQDVFNQNRFKAERTRIENWYDRHHDEGLPILFFTSTKTEQRLRFEVAIACRF